MFKRFKQMWERLIKAGDSFAGSLEEGDAKFRETLGLDQPAAKDADNAGITGRRNGTARKALAGKTDEK